MNIERGNNEVEGYDVVMTSSSASSKEDGESWERGAGTEWPRIPSRMVPSSNDRTNKGL